MSLRVPGINHLPFLLQKYDGRTKHIGSVEYQLIKSRENFRDELILLTVPFPKELLIYL